MEMYVTIAAAAMIIGKKGSMLKQLHAKSGATITLDQMQQADGTKRVCIQGNILPVDIALKSITEMVMLCDDAKYEREVTARQTEEQVKKQEEEDAARRQKAERAAAASAAKEAARKEREDEERRVHDEKKWLEKKEKALKEAEEKKKLAAKIAANPFAFLGDSDGSTDDEDSEEREKKQPAGPDSKKKRKSKGAKGRTGASESPEEKKHAGRSASPPIAGAPRNTASDKVRRQSYASAPSAEENDSDDEQDAPADMIGMDKLLMREKEELQTQEMKSSFTSSRLQYTLHSFTRKGNEHENEDRVVCIDLDTKMSPSVVEKFLEGSESSKIPLFLVLDGHGGDQVAEEARQQLPVKIAQALERLIQLKGVAGREARDLLEAAMAEGFAGFEQETERMFESQGEKSGTCAVCVVLTDTDGLYRLSVANLGDCRAVIARKDGQKFVCVSLTKDHRATVSSEKTRIEACGGQVINKRALDILIPSRTFGDIKTKRKCPGAVIAEPELSHHDLIASEDCSLVLASDGLWDELKNQKVMDLLYRHQHNAQSGCTAITQAVLKKVSGKGRMPRDDLTVVVATFDWKTQRRTSIA